MDDEFTLCPRIEDMKDPLVEGCTKVSCSICKGECWASPATMLSIKEGIYPKEIVCTRCLYNKISDKEN